MDWSPAKGYRLGSSSPFTPCNSSHLMPFFSDWLPLMTKKDSVKLMFRAV